ncbi:MAG: AAA family ATPase [Armatimonadetes bacterium]|nr:AAA family ATPase [Armatimonadota bacterium]
MSCLLNRFKAARRVSTPLIAIRTPDPASTIETLVSGFEENPPPFLQWDVIRGLAGVNEAGNSALALFGSEAIEVSQNPVEALILAAKLPERTILFLHNSHRYTEQPAIAQAIWNLRDLYKSNKRTLVLLCPVPCLPAELVQDVWVLEEALPNSGQLATLVRAQYECAHATNSLPELCEETVIHAVDATIGLSAFPAEQAIALSITPNGLDIPSLWERKRQMIEQTPGLSVWRGGETFADIGGVQNAKTFLTRLVNGKEPPRAVVFIDEIEKALAGSMGDSSGVSQSFLGTLLSWMQDKEAQGCLFLGPPGAAKSAVAKAIGNTVGIPTISFDLSGMKASLVGESETNLRMALDVVQAVSQGRALFVATCNSLSALAPEIRRRFKEVTMFFDLPDSEERKVIWDIYLRKYGVSLEVDENLALPPNEGWTGAEIKQCCELAYRLDYSLVEASAYIVPVSKSAADQIEGLRSQAQGRFVSASYPGVFDKNHANSPGGTRAFGSE